MDDDELAEAGISKVQPTAEYDTFGSTAAELARKQAQAEASTRAGGQLSFLPDDIIAPVADSMGDHLYHITHAPPTSTYVKSSMAEAFKCLMGRFAGMWRQWQGKGASCSCTAAANRPSNSCTSSAAGIEPGTAPTTGACRHDKQPDRGC